MPAGRPTKYKKEFGPQLADHMTQGFSFESFGGVIGVAKDTLQKWERKYKEFAASRKKGETACLIWWERIGRAGMLGQPIRTADGKLIEVKKFNTAIWIFNMKNRFKWRDVEVPKEPWNGKDKDDKTKAREILAEVDAMMAELKKN